MSAIKALAALQRSVNALVKAERANASWPFVTPELKVARANYKLAVKDMKTALRNLRTGDSE